MKKKILALLIAAVMVLSLVPFALSADETNAYDMSGFLTAAQNAAADANTALGQVGVIIQDVDLTGLDDITDENIDAAIAVVLVAAEAAKVANDAAVAATEAVAEAEKAIALANEAKDAADSVISNAEAAIAALNLNDAADRAVADTLVAQVNAAIAAANDANEAAQAVITVAAGAVADANAASEKVAGLLEDAQEIIEDVEAYIEEVIFKPKVGEQNSYMDYLNAYLVFLNQVAALYDIAPATVAPGADADAYFDAMNGLVEKILIFNLAAYEEYQAALANAEAAYARAKAGTLEPTSSEAIYSTTIILQSYTSTSGGNGPYQNYSGTYYNGVFTTGFQTSFAAALVNYWTANDMHGDENLSTLANNIVKNKTVNMGTAASPQFFLLDTSRTANFEKVGDDYIYTLAWGTDEGVGLDKQQVIAVDWYLASNSSQVVSYIFILDGKYEKGDPIKLIFTADMYNSIGTNGIAIKRFVYDEDLTEVVLESLKALPKLSVVPGLVPPAANVSLEPFTFDFNPPPPSLYGSLSIDKTVEGTLLGEWLTDGDFEFEDIMDIIGGMAFDLYKANANGTDYDTNEWIASGDLVGDTIGFGNLTLETGWYALVETLTGKAAEVFENVDGQVVQYFFISGPVANQYLVSGGDFDFDYNAFYTIVNGYGTGGYRISTLGYTGLNNNGDIFYIGVTNTTTGQEYASFCANAGSKNFAGDNSLECEGYMVAKEHAYYNTVDYGKFLSALNYIEDKYDGNLNDNRIITQTVIWALLGAVNVYDLDGTNLNNEEKAAVVAAFEAAEAGYKGNGTIVDLVYLVCHIHEDDFEYCQPQLVPIYGGGTFDNKPKVPVEFNGRASFTKVLVDADDEEFMDLILNIKFELYMLDENDPADYTIKVGGTYSPEGYDGIIEVNNLDPGFYVFKEVDVPAGWAIAAGFEDGLFFEIRVEDNLTKTYWLVDDEYVIGTGGNLGIVGPDFENVKIGSGSLSVSGDATLKVTTETYKEIWQRDRTPYKSLSPSYGTVTATNAGNVPDILAGLNPKNGNPIFNIEKKTNKILDGSTPFVVPNSNHFVYAVLDRADLAVGVDLEFLVGNNYEVVGTGSVVLDGNNLVITIDDLYGGEFGAIAFTQVPVTNNGNIHSQKEKDLYEFGALTGFNHDGQLVIPCPAGDEIILYIHCGTLQFDWSSKDPNYVSDPTDPYFGYIMGPWSDWKYVGREKISEDVDGPNALDLDINLVITDEDGTEVFSGLLTTDFSLDNLKPGEYTIAWSWTYEGQSGSGSETVTVTAGANAPFNIQTIVIEKTVETYLGTEGSYDAGIDVGNEITNPPKK